MISKQKFEEALDALNTIEMYVEKLESSLRTIMNYTKDKTSPGMREIYFEAKRVLNIK